VLDLARRATPRVAIPLIAVLAVASACIPFNSQEEYLFNQTNGLRRDNGVPTMMGMDELTERARELAAGLAAKGRLAHSDLSQLGVPWTAAAENVGRASSIEEIYRLLEASPSHRRNMLDPRYVRSGVGTARAKDGTIYAVQILWRG